MNLRSRAPMRIKVCISRQIVVRTVGHVEILPDHDCTRVAERSVAVR